MGQYLQILDQVIDTFTHLERLARDPQSIDKLRPLCKTADQLLARLERLSISWTLEEYIGSQTGLFHYLVAHKPSVDDVFEGTLEDLFEEEFGEAA